MGRQIKLYMFLFVLLFVVGCSDNEVVDLPTEPQVDGKEEHYEHIIHPNNKLGFSLLDQVDTNDAGNVFISPTSALIAILIAYNGAEGETKEEMAEALSIQNLSTNEINESTAALVKVLDKESDAMELSIANSIWLNDQYHFTEKFSQNVNNYFHAEVSEIDITDNASVKQINHWVSNSTKGKIENLVEAPLDPDMVALLINALYFNGKWAYEFDKTNTEEKPFY